MPGLNTRDKCTGHLASMGYVISGSEAQVRALYLPLHNATSPILKVVGTVINTHSRTIFIF